MTLILELVSATHNFRLVIASQLGAPSDRRLLHRVQQRPAVLDSSLTRNVQCEPRKVAVMGAVVSHCQAEEVPVEPVTNTEEVLDQAEPQEHATMAAAQAETQLSQADVEAVKEEIVNEYVERVLEEAGDDLITAKVETAPYDPRFPAQNQARHCFVRYNEYYKCAFERDPESDRCQFYKRAYNSLCPADWVEEWETLRSEGKWFGKY